ncbi:hypothetical protein QBC38DRAFT_458777 [Podospora fimiseda]|uniref:Uncharacterized protein n=1 Tax=Podospora fimiseda TaxID=252190 RepID=A0AAN7BIF6_9PEZI|nr:hypothetical protein QBC38DRAFT_458777 [Podospora fimiseda]
MVRLQHSAFLFTIIPFSALAASIRWMLLGDSITDYGCRRAWIWERFQREGYDIDLVGGKRADPQNLV